VSFGSTSAVSNSSVHVAEQRSPGVVLSSSHSSSVSSVPSPHDEPHTEGSPVHE
jgi:hypothetical protein